tara:strand:- start:243 stop:671 length:429 start_codon:yes stop_codon:yes gene_type:complete
MGELCDRFFGGADSFRRRLFESVERDRIKNGVSPEEIDEVCGLGIRGMPLYSDIQRDPGKLTSWTYSLFSCALDPGAIDELFPIHFSQADRGYIEMHAKKVGGLIPPFEHFSGTRDDGLSAYLYFSAVGELNEEPCSVSLAA